MSLPKKNPCPNCGNNAELAVYTYEAGNRHVECLKCDYLGPAGTSIKQAIRLHNAFMDGRAAAKQLTEGAALSNHQQSTISAKS